MRPGRAYETLLGSGQSAEREQPPAMRPGAEPGSIDNPFCPRTRVEAEQLPSGAHFYDPQGVLRERY
jgi:hypothetical protein